ncbi:amiloride-sensitive sodium channel subunit gamma-like [Pelobates cultripes]|uniref:Amiloride-sensitive sodium channel subunit gamma-like n=1 Tax=Pelobates cultripes TaxID=61616 RepID=A0AAD1RSD5_PELCU|nr:amiloride-sensitive sodium channel subunit gamma-like [Pelobates cultripes]
MRKSIDLSFSSFILFPRDNVVKVVVYYQQLNYELIEEVPSMQLVDLFSSIGGLVGLWIGVSVCTVAEFFELILNLLTFFIRQIPKRDEESPTNPYTIPDPDPCSPGLQSDNCFAWDDDGSNLLGDQYNIIQGIHNPYECYNT